MHAIQNIVEVKKIALQNYSAAAISTKSRQDTVVVSDMLKEFLDINR